MARKPIFPTPPPSLVAVPGRFLGSQKGACGGSLYFLILLGGVWMARNHIFLGCANNGSVLFQGTKGYNDPRSVLAAPPRPVRRYAKIVKQCPFLGSLGFGLWVLNCDFPFRTWNLRQRQSQSCQNNITKSPDTEVHFANPPPTPSEGARATPPCNFRVAHQRRGGRGGGGAKR